MIRNFLPQLLAQKGVSIRQLARDTGVTYSTIWAMVHGQRRSVQLEVLDAVCQALGVQPGDIYRRPTPGQAPPMALEERPAPRRTMRPSPQPSPPAGKDAGQDWRSW
jgi:putative transcriptional regulator